MDEGKEADFTATALAALPSVHEIPNELIARWEALPRDQIVVPALPRLAWDKLYQAIELVNLATIESTSLALTVFADQSKREAALVDFASKTVLIQNSLKQFQEMLMHAAIEHDQGHGRE